MDGGSGNTSRLHSSACDASGSKILNNYGAGLHRFLLLYDVGSMSS
uniref:Uncharacterized protein n=1 Tax=Physcomitrium patens TaxID=3218 RepID=A0A2K1JRZ4_PHYPA|nr:hypothetical protein PHYPA_016683 [Physcomitrium patens]